MRVKELIVRDKDVLLDQISNCFIVIFLLFYSLRDKEVFVSEKAAVVSDKKVRPI